MRGSGTLRSLAGSVEDLLLRKAEEEPEGFNYKYVVAASFEDSGNHTTGTALFDNQAYPSPTVALALVDNVLKLLSGARAPTIAVNHPQPRAALDASEDILYRYVALPSPQQSLPDHVRGGAPLTSCRFAFAPCCNDNLSSWRTVLWAALLRLPPLSPPARVLSQGTLPHHQLALRNSSLVRLLFHLDGERAVYGGQTHPVCQQRLRGHFLALCTAVGPRHLLRPQPAAADEGCMVPGPLPTHHGGLVVGTPPGTGSLGQQLTQDVIPSLTLGKGPDTIRSRGAGSGVSSACQAHKCTSR